MAARNKVTKLFKIEDGKKLLLFLGGGIIIFLSITNLIFWFANKTAEAKIQPIKNEILYWEGVVEKTPTYRDGYLKLATLYWQLHDDKKAKENLDKASEVDPNSEKIKDLRKQLSL